MAPCRALPEGRAGGAGADIAVAIPLRATPAKADPVHHAVPEEPVVVARIGVIDRVRPVAQIAAVEDVRKVALPI